MIYHFIIKNNIYMCIIAQFFETLQFWPNCRIIAVNYNNKISLYLKKMGKRYE